MAASISCPTPETLRQLARGLLTDPDIQALEAHLAACTSCVARLEEIRPADLSSASSRDRTTELPSSPEARQTSLTADDDLQQVGSYVIDGKIGEGGMGVVLRGTDPVFQRSLAIKIIGKNLAADARMRSHFLDEARLMGQLQHPGIPPVHALGELPDGRPYFAMKLIKGQTLEALLNPVGQASSLPQVGQAASLPEAPAGWKPTLRADLPRFLAMFEQLCQTMAYAHSRNVIHRDLKPANVMVGAFGEVQVMDWGLAKVLGEPGQGEAQTHKMPEATVVATRSGGSEWDTQPGDVKGTTAYMSPEQARGEMDFGPRTDVFALGAILCKMLTGTPAFAQSNFENRLLAVQGLLQDAFARLEASGADQDLVGLTKRCLAPDKAERPADGAAVAQAVAAYRAAQVERLKQAEIARGVADMRTQEERKRRRIALALSAAVIVVLAGGIAAFAWSAARLSQSNTELSRANVDLGQAKSTLEETNLSLDAANVNFKNTNKSLDEANVNLKTTIANLDAAKDNLESTNTKLEQARKEADQKRKQAEDERKLAQALQRFWLHDILKQANPGEQADRFLARGRASAFATVENPTIKELLDRAAMELAADKIEAKFPGQPLVQAEILRTVGETYRGTGDYAKAVSHLKRLRAIYEAKLGPDHEGTLASMAWLALAYHDAGKLDLALPLYEEALKLIRAKLGPDHPNTLNSMNNLAMGYEAAGKLDLALPLHEETLKLSRAKLGPDHPSTLTSMSNLARGYDEAGKLDLALPLYEQTLKLRKAKLGADHPDTLLSMNDLATGYRAAAKLDLAMPLLEETLKLMKAKLGPDHPHTLGSMNNLAGGYDDAGKLDLALPLYEQTLKLNKAKLGPDHPHTLTSMNNLAASYQAAGKLDLALPLLEETLKLTKAKFGSDHPRTFISMGNLASGHEAAGKLDLALPLLEETLKLTKAKLGAVHPGTLTSMNDLAMGYRAAGKLDLALPLLEETLKLTKAKFGSDHPRTFISMGNLASSYEAAGKLDLALPLHLETHKLTKAKLGPDHPHTLTSTNNLAAGYHKAGKLDLALPLFEETLKLTRAKLGPDHPSTLIKMGNLASGYRAAGKLDLALPLYEETLKHMKAKLGPDHPDTLISMRNLAEGYRAAGKLDLALPLFEETLRLRKAKLGPDHPDTLVTMNNLAALFWRMKKLDRSIPLFEALLPIQKQKLGANHPDTLQVMANLGVNYHDAGRLDEALPLLEEAYRKGHQHASVAWVSGPLADAYVRAGRKTDAAALIEEDAKRARAKLPQGSPQLAQALASSALRLLQLNGYSNAETLLRECLAIREKQEADAWTTFNTQSALGGALLGQKKYTDAEPLLLAGYQGMKEREKTIPPQGKVRLTEALERLALLYEATGRKEDARKWSALLLIQEGKLDETIHAAAKMVELKGRLDAAAPTLIFQVRLKTNAAYVIDMVSPDPKALDPYLVLQDAERKTLAEDKGSGGNLNARILFRAPAEGIYRIRATSVSGGAGPFTLTVREVEKTKPGNERDERPPERDR